MDEGEIQHFPELITVTVQLNPQKQLNAPPLENTITCAEVQSCSFRALPFHPGSHLEKQRERTEELTASLSGERGKERRQNKNFTHSSL